MTNVTGDDYLSTAKAAMMVGAVDDAAKLLNHLWRKYAAIDAVEYDGLWAITIELADRFPLARSTSDLLHRTAVTLAARGDLRAATEAAARMLSVWRARCQQDRSTDSLFGHAHASDVLAGIYRARGMVDEVVGLLVELAEWHFTTENDLGFAWALRELGAIALLRGDLDNAAGKFARADEIYGSDSSDSAVAEERAECRVLRGRVAHARGDHRDAERWFALASQHLTGEAGSEAGLLLAATVDGSPLPATRVLTVSTFGVRACCPPYRHRPGN
ncbi:hypothetical protein AB0I60_11875 [Actinosynnema sp. NPDC050436]|uniref:hypothetical protein n=1 Tax=Actinosynnema sp. NPDC050436 TaxID=3155659 RepID=UPI0033E2FD0C